MSNQNVILKAILECGTDDLCVLDDIEYDLGDIVDGLLAEGIKPTLNAITGKVFRKGVEELTQLISDRLCEPGEDDSEEALSAIRSLSPEKDIGWFCNCLDTHIYFQENERIYREHLADEISQVEESMGFSF